jgi:hypothetical protein
VITVGYAQIPLRVIEKLDGNALALLANDAASLRAQAVSERVDGESRECGDSVPHDADGIVTGGHAGGQGHTTTLREATTVSDHKAQRQRER